MLENFVKIRNTCVGTEAHDEQCNEKEKNNLNNMYEHKSGVPQRYKKN